MLDMSCFRLPAWNRSTNDHFASLKYTQTTRIPARNTMRSSSSSYRMNVTGAKNLSHTMKKKRRMSPATSMPMITGESHFRIIGLGGRRNKSQLSDEDEHADDVDVNTEVL
ncbi:hypothetical protein HBI56_047960 [Parastagonospora nodorum]|uniref:Uncharacterized protein n=1 Tax=Phaeosphaeria nodorum (strain SN15 / ATCC MYA-4574 / FGSC 10173) TaxID=321614 RepID=A0A7U2ESK5_PHANO|nr:hypothetical protein HBH56_060900 [Parastagonospora nodorum]QRC91927.1 hypothetical protein JI435_301430 [Parastagonospora nodorum SN15]KAH3930753.1 hypothetical protein HBH54_104830 [Parastagonospora nodorum]KAH3968160.1 hypothetical protein HBH51_133960 [Parastagonospora nodorum]KAH4074107.1 hypothetical protein HBH50_042660 [Parastagonospora nodorum]